MKSFRSSMSCSMKDIPLTRYDSMGEAVLPFNFAISSHVHLTTYIRCKNRNTTKISFLRNSRYYSELILLTANNFLSKRIIRNHKVYSEVSPYESFSVSCIGKVCVRGILVWGFHRNSQPWLVSIPLFRSRGKPRAPHVLGLRQVWV